MFTAFQAIQCPLCQRSFPQEKLETHKFKCEARVRSRRERRDKDGGIKKHKKTSSSTTSTTKTTTKTTTTATKTTTLTELKKRYDIKKCIVRLRRISDEKIEKYLARYKKGQEERRRSRAPRVIESEDEEEREEEEDAEKPVEDERKNGEDEEMNRRREGIIAETSRVTQNSVASAIFRDETVDQSFMGESTPQDEDETQDMDDDNDQQQQQTFNAALAREPTVDAEDNGGKGSWTPEGAAAKGAM